MPVFTVHEPPQHAANAAADPERFVFVRDGFYVWAFLLAPLWMLWHRMWLVLLIYVLIAGGIENAMYYAGISTTGIILIQPLIALLIGIEAATLRRFVLARRGWKAIGVVSGDDLEAAERRFFDAWARKAPGVGVVQPAAGAPSAVPRTSPSPDIIGLFPDPGVNR